MSGIFAGKQFYVLLAGWFVLSYAVLWFIGGGCTDILSGGTCISKVAAQGLSAIPLVNLILPFQQWMSLMYWFAPIAGFVIGYFVLQWYTEYYDSKFAIGPWFVVLLVLALLLGYYINLTWYYGESARLNSRNGVSVDLYFCVSETTDALCDSTVNSLNQQYQNLAQTGQTQTIKQFIAVKYWSELRQSIYLTFILGAFLAWVPLFIRNIVTSKKE